MALRDDQERFHREIERVIEEIPKIHRDLQAELVGRAVDELVARSEPFVRSSAYRAAHFVGIGSDAPTKLVYDSPEHPDPAIDYKPGAQIFQVPDGSLARAAYEEEEPFQRAVLSNDRFYADTVEVAHSTYDMVSTVTEQNAQEIANRNLKTVIR